MSDVNEASAGTDCSTDLRYAIYEGSQSGHCCFDATVVDTTKPHIIGGKHYKGSDGQYHYETVCECFDREDAERICAALNATDSYRVRIVKRAYRWSATQFAEFFRKWLIRQKEQ